MGRGRFRWQRMLDEGVCGTIQELAEREKVNRGYMSRVLRLTLLAPDIVEAILDGRQPEGMRLEDLLDGFRWSGTGSGSTSASIECKANWSPFRAELSRRARSRAC